MGSDQHDHRYNCGHIDMYKFVALKCLPNVIRIEIIKSLCIVNNVINDFTYFPFNLNNMFTILLNLVLLYHGCE